jgi:hypothetical protein
MLRDGPQLPEDWRESVRGYEAALAQAKFNLLSPQVYSARLTMLQSFKKELTKASFKYENEEMRLNFEGMIWKNYLYPYVELFRKIQRVLIIYYLCYRLLDVKRVKIAHWWNIWRH